MKKSLLLISAVLSSGFVSCTKNKNAFHNNSQSEKYNDSSSSQKTKDFEENNNSVIFKLKLSTIKSIKNNEEELNFKEFDFYYQTAAGLPGSQKLKNERDTEFKITTNSPLRFREHSFFVHYENTDHILTRLIVGQNNKVPVDFGEYGKWVESNWIANVWQKFPDISACDLSYDHKNQTQRVYSPGSIYEINFYVMDSYLSYGKPDSAQMNMEHGSQYPTWLMCDIAKI